MKKRIFLSALALILCVGGYAQNFMVVNSESIFKSSAAYNTAIAQIEKLTNDTQKSVDTRLAQLDKMYNDYESQKEYLSPQMRKTQEAAIINREKEINKFQDDTFGQEGTIMKKRVEMIKPIQDNIFSVINKYAANNNFDLVLDIATSPMVMYYSPKIDRTQQIITLIK